MGQEPAELEDVAWLAAAAARRMPCLDHLRSIGEARRPARSGRFLKQVVADPERFVTRQWDREVVLSPGVVPTGLFAGEDMARLLGYGGLRIPEVRLTKDRSGVPLDAYSSDRQLGYTHVTGVVDRDRVEALVAEGATLLFQGIRRFWEPIDTFAAGLEGDIGAPVQATVFFTPSNGTGIPKHHDLHSVFVMQLEGARRWTYGTTAVRRPEAHVDPASIPDDSLAGDIILKPGDCLYIPRGTPHLAHPVPGQSSLHLTLSLRDAPTIADVAAALLASVIEADVAFDRTVPVPPEGPDDRLAAAVRECLDLTAARIARMPDADVAALARRAIGATLTRPE